jgi:hypothetical protein
MKREHFDWLWRHCSPDGVGFVLDPVDQGVDRATRNGWISEGVLYDDIEIEVKAQSPDLEGLLDLTLIASVGFVVEQPIAKWINEASRFHHPFLDYFRYKDYVELRRKAFSINREKLTAICAKDWRIDHYYFEVPPCGHLIGFKDGEHHVLVVSGEIDRLLLPTVAIDTRENLGLTMEDKKSKKTYIVKAGTTVLTYLELLRLYEGNIVFAGTHDFLTDEGDPVWEFEYIKEVETETHPIDLFSRDPVTGGLMYDGAIIHLTPTEDIIFWQFRKRFGMAVNKDELRHMVWRGKGKKEPGYPEENLRNHIFRLKKALEEHTPFTIEPTGLGNYRMRMRELQDKKVKIP